MKVEGPLYLIKGLRPDEAKPRFPSKKVKDPDRAAGAATSADIITLVRRENRRAILPDPQSLDQAKDLVIELIDRLPSENLEGISKTHRLDPALVAHIL